MKKNTTKFLIVAIIMSILNIPALFGIIFIGTHKSYILLGICIAYIVICFYGLPFVWIHYSEQKKALHIIQLIQNQKIYAVQELIQATGYSRKDIVSSIRYAIKKEYLQGVLFDGEQITRNDKSNQKIILVCPSCGAKNPELLDNHTYHCKFCDTTFKS